MDKKIVTIAVTILMFALCIIAAITLSIVLGQKNSDLIESRTGTYTLSIGDETEEMVVRGSALISSIVGIGDIEDRIPSVKESVYGHAELNGTTTMTYSFRFGSETNWSNIVKKLSPDSLYTIKYINSNDSSKPIYGTNNILIEINQFVGD